MYGAIIGDVCGSTREFFPIKEKDFELLPEGSDYTDDTIMTIAVARGLLRYHRGERNLKQLFTQEMQRLGRAYPFPKGGYGGGDPCAGRAQ